MADAHRRRFDAVVVWKFDRFARSVSHLLRALETFKALGIDFVSLSEQVDTSTPTGKMVFTVLGAVAELERSLTAERVRAGIRNARAKGKKLGRARVAVDGAKIAALRAQGHSWVRSAGKQAHCQGDGPAGLLQPASDRGTFDPLILRKRARRHLAHSWPRTRPWRVSNPAGWSSGIHEQVTSYWIWAWMGVSQAKSALGLCEGPAHCGRSTGFDHVFPDNGAQSTDPYSNWARWPRLRATP
jgi:hypothetical protein